MERAHCTCLAAISLSREVALSARHAVLPNARDMAAAQAAAPGAQAGAVGSQEAGSSGFQWDDVVVELIPCCAHLIQEPSELQCAALAFPRFATRHPLPRLVLGSCVGKGRRAGDSGKVPSTCIFERPAGQPSPRFPRLEAHQGWRPCPGACNGALACLALRAGSEHTAARPSLQLGRNSVRILSPGRRKQSKVPTGKMCRVLMGDVIELVYDQPGRHAFQVRPERCPCPRLACPFAPFPPSSWNRSCQCLGRACQCCLRHPLVACRGQPTPPWPAFQAPNKACLSPSSGQTTTKPGASGCWCGLRSTPACGAGCPCSSPPPLPPALAQLAQQPPPPLARGTLQWWHLPCWVARSAPGATLHLPWGALRQSAAPDWTACPPWTWGPPVCQMSWRVGAVTAHRQRRPQLWGL